MPLRSAMRIRDEFVFDGIAESVVSEREESLALVSIIFHSIKILSVLAYAVCYNIGIVVIKSLLRVNDWYNDVFSGLVKQADQRREEKSRIRQHRWHEFFRPLRELISVFVWAKNARSTAHGEEKLPLGLVIRLVTSKLAGIFWRLILTAVNIIAPLAAVFVLAATIRYFTGMNYGIQVEYGGKILGNVQNEAQFYEAQRLMNERLINAPKLDEPETIPRFTLMRVPADSYVDLNVMADKMIELSGHELFEGYGLYIDGSFEGAVNKRDSVWLLDELNTRLDGSDVPGRPIGFNRKIKLEKSLFPLSAETDMDSIETLLGASESVARSYTVQKGDTPIKIADKNGINYDDLIKLNPDIEKNLQPGDQIIISGGTSFLQVVSLKTETRRESIPFTTNRITDNSEYIGSFKILNDGDIGEREIISEVTYVGGERQRSQEIAVNIIKEPIPQRIMIGGRRPSGAMKQQNDIIDSMNNEMFMWPVDGGYVYMPIWGYTGHTGNDISSVPVGTPIRAAASGTVIYSGYTAGGYGRHIKIDHGNNIVTLYGHNSANYVSVGDKVIQGQKIAAIGSTGNSTGPHCHFEIIINGQYVDARKYIGSRSPR